MLTSQARISTGRPVRYLVQICKHVSSIHGANGRSHAPGSSGPDDPGTLPRAEWSENSGVISFDGGTITLLATADTLTLRAEAADEDSLQRAQDLASKLIARIGRRDVLTITWSGAIT